jgi:hypothetical protein
MYQPDANPNYGTCQITFVLVANEHAITSVRISNPGLICMDSVIPLNFVGVYINAPEAGTVRTELVRRAFQLQRASHVWLDGG